jgi:Flp pilus assembly protein TadG
VTLNRHASRNRIGVAAVEMAVTLPFLLCLAIGIIVLGRIIQVQAILADAVDVTARQAAQGQYNSYNASTQTYTTTQVALADLKATLNNYLTAAGVNNTGTTVTFSAASGATDPYLAVSQDLLTISATLPYSSFGWTNYGLFIPTGLTGGKLDNAPTSISSSMQIWSMNAVPINVPVSPPEWNGYPSPNP